ncbi:hypothetical protein CPB86DRAFT_813359 [Serendipita vermifera]|nr:hypothetical protein CPB86DRAFT_813359 [Serendipita vermifera]
MDYRRERQKQQESRLRARGATWKPSGKPCTLQFVFDSDEQRSNGIHSRVRSTLVQIPIIQSSSCILEEHLSSITSQYQQSGTGDDDPTCVQIQRTNDQVIRNEDSDQVLLENSKDKLRQYVDQDSRNDPNLRPTKKRRNKEPFDDVRLGITSAEHKGPSKKSSQKPKVEIVSGAPRQSVDLYVPSDLVHEVDAALPNNLSIKPSSGSRHKTAKAKRKLMGSNAGLAWSPSGTPRTGPSMRKSKVRFGLPLNMSKAV